MRFAYIGYVINKQSRKQTPVSVSDNKQRAGELMEQWIQDNDKDFLDYDIGGVLVVAHYIEFN